MGKFNILSNRMKKIKYILASLVLTIGFTSCETEAIDEKVLDETTPGMPILRFELNDQQTVVTDKVTFAWTRGDAFTLTAKFSVVNEADSNPETRYTPATLTISYNNFAMAYFPTKLSLDNPNNYVSSPVLEIQGVGRFSASNAKENQKTGYSNITSINDQARYIGGDFNYILYPPEGSTLTPQRLTVGSFNYIHYE